MRGGPAFLERREHRARASAVVLVQLAGFRAQPCEQDVAVAHLTEQGGEPSELVACAGRERRLDERAERAQVGAQPSRCDPRLVDSFRIDVEPDHRVVQDEADH